MQVDMENRLSKSDFENDGSNFSKMKSVIPLVPLSAFLLYFTFRHPQLISGLVKRTVYKGRVPNKTVLLLVDMTSRFMIVGSFFAAASLCLGVNPLSFRRRMRESNEEPDTTIGIDVLGKRVDELPEEL